jgi:hypothetical protein
VKFLHHDDWFTYSHSLGSFAALLEGSPSASLAFSASNVCEPHGKWKWTFRPEVMIEWLRQDPRELLLGNIVGVPSATIYRHTDVQNGFDCALRWVVDIDFYLSILTENPRFAYTPDPLVSIADGGAHQVTSSVRQTDVALQEWFYLYGKWASGFPLRGRQAAFLHQLLREPRSPANGAQPLALKGRAARLFTVARLLSTTRILWLLRHVP